MSKDSFHDPMAILLSEINSKFICSTGGAGQHVRVVDDVDEDSSDFINGAIQNRYKGYLGEL